MKCSKCGLENRPDARFCQQCGQPLKIAPTGGTQPTPVSCPTCGAKARPGARYCQQCGQTLPVTSPGTSPPSGATCAACGAAVKSGARFCPRCGRPVSARPVSPTSLAALQPVPPSAPPPAAKVRPSVQAQSSGQVAIGGMNVHIGAIYGGKVNISPPKPPPVRRRSWPVSLLPRPVASLLDRESEVKTSHTAFKAAQSVEFFGPAGLGKTTLLEYLAHQGPTASFAAGIVHLQHQPQTVPDLLLEIFDAFYIRDRDYKPTDTQIRYDLQNVQALILLDDVKLDRDEIKALLDSAPKCTFLLASTKRCLWGQGHSIALQGLPPDAAVALIERELGRSLTRQEYPAVEDLCKALKGHPLYLLRAATLVRDNKLSLAEVLDRVQQAPSPTRALTTQLLNSLSEKGRQVLAALAALDGVPLGAEHLAALAGLPDAVPVLKPLLRQGLVQAHSPRYSLTGDLGQVLQQEWDLTPWAERALVYFTAWAEGKQAAPDRLVEEAGPILRVLAWAVGAKRWAEVVRLGRAVEGALAFSGRWGAWAQVLNWMLLAARGLADRTVEALVLHQLGTRALCLGEKDTARSLLNQALQLRQALGDQAGAAVTQHNLNLLLSPPPVAKQPTQPTLPSLSAASTVSGTSALLKAVIITASILLLAALGGLGIWFIWPQATPTPSPIPLVDTNTSTPTASATPTSTPSPTTTSVPTRTPRSTNTATRRPTNTSTPRPTFTFTPPPTGTPTFTPIPTSTFTPIPTPSPIISFMPEFATIDEGECVLLQWQIENVQAAFLGGGGFNNQPVTGPFGSQQVCPSTNTTYVLRVVLLNNDEVFRNATLTVISLPTPLPTPTNQPPTARITQPATDSGIGDPEYQYDGSDSFGAYTDVTLQGSATDPEESTLSGSSLVWTTNRTDIHQNPPSPMLGTGTNVTARLYFSDCPTEGEHGDWHEITLTATDSHGSQSTAVRRIYIWTYCIF